ncbi:MAG: DUF115 domain-containing protein [Chitinivibrionales bacterium]|nr:DUF115 domain-containing protein [Chitinivibrionales bacterium]MBD3397313.1 DUF115 domain-containing protein [Chitinivibrionales bacterium]
MDPASPMHAEEKALLARASQAANTGQLGDAVKLFTEACRKFPHNVRAHVLLADVLLLDWFPPAEQLATVRKLIDHTLRAFPDSGEAKQRAERLQAKETQITAVEQGKKRLEEFEGKHRGERCVIIGNGPSLNRMDLSFLKDEFCFGLNRIYLGFERFGFTPTYLVAVNRFVIEQSAADLTKVPCTKFISFEGVPSVMPADDLIVINPRTWEDVFSTDPRQGVCIGSTVTYVAMQLAFWMGFDDVVLIGVDHKFATQGTPHAVVESQGSDPNHFDPNYFGKGIKWQLPDLKNSEQMFRIADAYFRAYRNKIVDATLDGACQVFEKAHYKDIFFPSGA